jgi:dihydroxy-acid dehydratase
VRQVDGEHVDIEDVFVGGVQVAFGKLDADRLRRMADNAIAGPALCQGMATANSMHVAVEALGMALPGSAPVRANSPEDDRLRAALGRAHRRDGARGPQAARRS